MKWNWYLLLIVLMMCLGNGLRAHGETEMLRFGETVQLSSSLAPVAGTTDAPAVQAVFPASNISREAFSRVLVNGLASHLAWDLEIRVGESQGEWSDWEKATLRIFPDGRFWARLDRRDAVYHRAQIRILSKNDQPLEMTLFAVEGIEREEEARVLSGEKEARPSPEPFEVLTDSISRPAVVSRAEWGANPPIGTYIPHSPYRLTQHHTAGRRVSTLAEGIAEMQFIQDFHQNGRGWQDIGYHFLVDDAGRLYEGVPSDYRGTHVGNNNTGNVGISYMGNLDLAGENPTTTALLSLADMWSWLAYHYTINPDSLFGHRDYNSTACPGGNLYVRLPNLRNAVRGQLGFGAPYVIYPVPQPFSQEVDPGSHIQFSIVDDVEGVDISSIDVRLNGAPISPVILGDSSQVNVLYQPPAPFPASQNVVVNVYALDLGAVPDTLRYSYTFSIEIAALQVELNSPTTVSNGSLNLSGGWSIDSDDATITGLANGNRLIARDTDSSHVARIFPGVTQPGDYRIQMATGSNFLGESSRLIFVDDNGRAHTVFREYNTLTLDQWSTVAPTPVYLNGDAADSLGYFELRGIGDMPTRLILDAFRLEKVDRYDPPTIPNLKSVRLTNPASREVEVAWYPNLEGDIAGYRLFASDDGRSWSDTPFADETLLGPTAETYRFNYPGATTQAYFRLVAVDTNEVELPGGLPEPLLSPVSDIYGVGFQRRGEILIVDNFDRRGSWQAAQHPFARSHGEALDDQEHGFDTCSETAVQNGDVRLEDYDVVFYFCGDDSRSDESLAAADQYRLAEYLFNGGKLFISGSEIGYDFASTTNEELQRYENTLKARYMGDLAGSTRVRGYPTTVFEGLDFEYGTISNDENYFEDYPDYIEPAGGSSIAMVYGNNRIAAIQYTGSVNGGSSDAQVVYMGFPLETINTRADRSQLMRRVLTYFGLAVGIGDEPPTLAGRFDLAQNFPNPFNPTTTIAYQIPGGLARGEISLRIYNSLGQLVKELKDLSNLPGEYRINWDGLNLHGEPVASGIYLYRLKAGKWQAARKMMLIR